MSKKEKIWGFLGHIDSTYIDEAAKATRLGRSSRRRWMSLGNIAAVFVGLVAVSFVVAAAFWLGGTGMFNQPIYENGPENGPYAEQNGSDTSEHTPEPSPAATPTLSQEAQRAQAAAKELIMQFPSIFVPVGSYPWGETEGKAFVFVAGATWEDLHFIDAEGNRLEDVPFIEETLGSIANSYRLFDDGSGVPVVFIHFQSQWVTTSMYAMYRFDGTEYVFVNWVGGFGGTMMQIEGRWIYPFINDAGDILIYSGDQLGGAINDPTRDRVVEHDPSLGSYSIGQRYEWGDVVDIFRLTEDRVWDPITILREEFDALRFTPDYFSLFPGMQDMIVDDFRLMEPMTDLQEQLTNSIAPVIQERTPIISTPIQLSPTPNPRYEYLEVTDNRIIGHILTAITEAGFVVQDVEPLDTHWDLLAGGMFFRIRDWENPYASAQVFEFNDVRSRVLAFDQYYARYQSPPSWVYNGRFAIETTHQALREFFATIE